MEKPEDASARLWKAESVVALLAKVDVDKLPAREGEAVGKCQAEAMDEWLDAYLDLRGDKREQSREFFAPVRRTF